MYLRAVRDIKEMSPDVNLLFMSSFHDICRLC